MAATMAPQSVLPIHIQQTAIAQQLGPFVKVYKTNLIKLGCTIILGVAIGLVALGYASQSGDAFLFVVGLVCLGLAALFIYTTSKIAGRRIYLFQQGLIIEHKRQVQVLPWNQIAELWQNITRRYYNGIYVGTTYRYRLHRMDGYKIKLDNNTKRISELGAAITKGVSQELTPRARYSINAGQTLMFGQFSINAQGIGNGREFIPWQQVQDIRVKNGRVSVKKAGKFFNWGSTRVAKIPNFFVFLAVTQEMIQQANGARMPVR